MSVLTLRIFNNIFKRRDKVIREALNSSISDHEANVYKEIDFKILYKIKHNKVNLKFLRGVERDNLSECRKSVVKEYMECMRGLTQPQKAQLIVDYANAKAWTEHNYLSGTRLSNMTQDISVPGWVMNAAFDLMLQKGWLPQYPYPNNPSQIQRVDDTFAMFIFFWMDQKGPFISVEQVLASLPKGIDKNKAAEWIGFLSDRLGKSKKMKFFCHFSDAHGNKIGKIKTNLSSLSHELKHLLDEYSYEELKSQGYRLSYAFGLIE